MAPRIRRYLGRWLPSDGNIHWGFHQHVSPAQSSAVTHPKFAVIWVNFGPYHLARIRALTEKFQVTGIELASWERLYSWKAAKTAVRADFQTIRDGDGEH